MSRPSVCHVTSVHVPTDGRILYHQCRSLARTYEVTLVCLADSPPETLHGVRILAAGPRPSSRRERWACTAALVRAAENTRADLYHFHDPELIGPMRSLGERAHRPVVYDVHEHYPHAIKQRAWIPELVRGPLALAADIHERRSARSFDGLVVADDALGERFIPLNPRVAVVRNYPPLDLFPPRESQPRVRRPTLVYSGSISIVRGLEVMIAVLDRVRSRYPECRLILAGTPTEDALAPLSSAIDREPGAIEHYGPIPYDRLSTLLAQADVGLSLLLPHPKFEINVPTKVFDYMASGLPYVASTSGPLSRLTRGAGGALVPGGDVDAAADAVLHLLDDPQLAAATGSVGRAMVERELSWEDEAESLLDLYEDLLSDRRAR